MRQGTSWQNLRHSLIPEATGLRCWLETKSGSLGCRERRLFGQRRVNSSAVDTSWAIDNGAPV
jgi:hypothetical protein